MSGKRPGVLISCPFFRPNVGGVETHLNDLCEYLKKCGNNIYVVTYQPLTTKARAPAIEKNGDLWIRRIRWPGYNLFHKLEPFPLAEFLYLTPRLLAATFLFLLIHGKKINVIHGHGFNSAFIGRILKPIFGKRVVVSTHAIYNLKRKSLFSRVLAWTLNGADSVVCLSQPSMEELRQIGVRNEKLGIYTYWVNQRAFRPLDKNASKDLLGWKGRFIALFVGRFIEKKGVRLLLEAARAMAAHKDIFFAFIGDGPLAGEIERAARESSNIIFAGRVDNEKLPLYYNAADILCVPSLYEEGFGRVIAEAFSCGVPVIASRRGAIPDIITDRTGILIEPGIAALKDNILKMYRDRGLLEGLSRNCRDYAVERFSEKNAQAITAAYRIL